MKAMRETYRHTTPRQTHSNGTVGAEPQDPAIAAERCTTLVRAATTPFLAEASETDR